MKTNALYKVLAIESIDPATFSLVLTMRQKNVPNAPIERRRAFLGGIIETLSLFQPLKDPEIFRSVVVEDGVLLWTKAWVSSTNWEGKIEQTPLDLDPVTLLNITELLEPQRALVFTPA